jgi:ABC-type sugar transport system substrate-binding protein
VIALPTDPARSVVMPSRTRSRCARAALALRAGAVALAVAACGGGDGGGSSAGAGDGGARKAADDVTLAMITATTTQNAFQEMAFGARAAAGVEGVRLNSAAPNGINGPQQVQLFQAAMQTAKDGIATETTTPDLFVRPFSQAAGRGIPQVSVDTPPPAGSRVETFVGNDNAEVGAVLATAMLDRIPAGATGEIVLGNPIPGLPVLDQRIAGMRRVLQAERPRIRLTGPFNTGAEPTQNFNAWTGIVKAHPNAIAYLDPGDQAVVSLARIQQQTGRKLLVGGADVDPVALQAVKDGRVYALADPEHWLKGYIAIALLARRARDGTALPKGWWNPGSALITARNVDQVLARQKDNATRTAYFKATVDRQLADPQRYLKPLPAGR